MNRRAKLLIVGSMGAAALLAWAYAGLYGSHEPPRDLVPVRRASFDVDVDTLGELDAAGGQELVSSIQGDKAKIVKLVADGSRVVAGQVLVGFDPTFFESEVRRLQGELAVREGMVEGAGQAVELERSQSERAVNNAIFERANAQRDFDRHRSYISDLKALQAQGHDFGSEIIQAQRKADEAEATLQKAGAEVERQRREAQLKVAQAEAAQGIGQDQLDTVRAQLQEAQQELDKTTLTAPIAGFVILHDLGSDPGKRRKLQVGDSIWQGQSVLYIPDLSSMIVKTRVREMDMDKLKPSQAAMVHVDAFPDSEIAGQVESIGVLAGDDAGTTEKYFQYTVRLQGTDDRLRPGMTARIHIVTDSVKDALTVPVAAIFNENGANYCYADEWGQLKARPVSVGRQNDDLAEVSAGLAEGDKVSLVKP